MTEAEVLEAVLLEYGARPDMRVWRNNRGKAQMPSGRWVDFGVDGQGDISGIWWPSGKRIEIETKRPRNSKQREAQRRFQAMIVALGGIYVLARSVADCDAVFGPPPSKEQCPRWWENLA